MCPIYQYSVLSSLAFVLAGILMSTMGAGGGLLALPTFLVILKAPISSAIAASAAVVGFAAFSTFFDKENRENLPKRAALWFLLPLVFSSAAGALLVPHLDERLVAGVLVGLLAFAGWNALRTRAQEPGDLKLVPLATAGSGVGVLMGLMGVGGGLLTVPALIRWAGLEREKAISLSLLGVGLGALASLVLHYNEGAFRLGLILPALVAAMIGMEIGTLVRRRLPIVLQTRISGVILWSVAIGVVVHSLL